MNLQTEPENSKLEPALWYCPNEGKDFSTVVGTVQKYFKLRYISFHENLKEAVRLLNPQLLFVCLRKEDASCEKRISHLKNDASHMKVVFVLEEVDADSIELFLNEFDTLAIFDNTSNPSELEKVLKKSSQVLKVRHQNQETITQIKNQNRQLEILTEGLEALVKERTKDIEISKNEIELKVRKVKQLVSFIKSLSTIRKVDDLLVIIREEIRKAYGIGEAFLACDSGDYGPWILYFQRSDVATIKTKGKWNTGVKLRINEASDQQYLANTFGRPFGRVIAFPLQSKGRDSRDVVLFIEHQLLKEQIEPFIDYMGERLQSLSLALDRSLLEVALKRASFLWESTFDSIDDPIAIYNEQHEVIRSNKMFSEVRKSVESFSDEGFGGVYSMIDKCLSSRTSKTHSFNLKNRFFEANCYPIIFHQDDPVSSVVVHFVDVTNYKTLQSTMIQNEKMSAIGHLAGNIAHELNNPLTGIRSLCQILIEEQKDLRPSITEDLKEVEEAANRSQKIINNLLAFSHSASENKLEIVNLNDLVRTTLPLLKSVTFEYDREFLFSEEKLMVEVEPHLTQQVIFNLINNSCQAMRGQKGELKIITEKIGEQARFSVQDTGPGVSGDLGSAIFDPFVTTKSQVGGTGLGLSMSQRVIRKMGGEIDFQSTPKSGAHFWFTLPLVERS